MSRFHFVAALTAAPIFFIAGAAYAQTYAGSGFVESVQDNGFQGAVFDNTAGSTAFSDAGFPSTGLGVGDAVTYDVNCSRVGCIATNLVGAAPTPDLIISGSQNGSVTVSAGELVHITGSVQHDVVVDGGTVVLFSGASVGRDLEVTNGGHAEINDATIGRDLEGGGGGGTVHLSSGTVGRDFDFQGLGIYTALTVGSTDNSSAGTFVVGRDFLLDGEFDLEVGASLDVDRDLKSSNWGGWRWQENDGAHVVRRDVIITTSGAGELLGGGWCLFAGRDVYLRADGGGPTVNGEVHADVGDIFMIAGGGSGSFSGTHIADGLVEYDCVEGCLVNSTSGGQDLSVIGGLGDGGGIVTIQGEHSFSRNIDVTSGSTTSIDGTLTAGDDISLSSSADTVINGSIEASTGPITLDSGADLTVTGTVNAGDDVTLDAAGHIEISETATFAGGGSGADTVIQGASLTLGSKLTDPGELLAAVTGGMIVAVTPEGEPQAFEYSELTLEGAAASGPMSACPTSGPSCTIP